MGIIHEPFVTYPTEPKILLVDKIRIMLLNPPFNHQSRSMNRQYPDKDPLKTHVTCTIRNQKAVFYTRPEHLTAARDFATQMGGKTVHKSYPEKLHNSLPRRETRNST